MQAILYCDRQTDCIPAEDCPEALLPFCNIPLLEHLLHYIEQKGFQNAVLLAADDRVKAFLDTISLQMPVQFARSLASLHAHVPTLLLRRLCLPEWDMTEFFSLCQGGAVRLYHADGTPAYAELHPQGSVLLEPEQTAMLKTSVFRHVTTPGEYREIQQKLLHSRKFLHSRIGEGVRIGEHCMIDHSTIIGHDCRIGNHVHLERCVLGDGVQIGADAILKDCVICRKALIDQDTRLDHAVIPEKSVIHAENHKAQERHPVYLPEDGICEGLPRWNTAATALNAGAAMTALGNIAIGYSQEQTRSFAIAAASGAVSQGASIWFAGQCSLAQLIHVSATADCEAILWIQGERLLPFSSDGFPLGEAQSRRLREALESGISQQITAAGNFYHAENFLLLWEQECRRILPPFMHDITISCANAGLRHTAQRLFMGGTGERITLSLSEDGTRISAFSSETGMIRHEQLILISLFSFWELKQPLLLPEDFHPEAEAFAKSIHAEICRLQPEFLKAFQKQAVCIDGIKLFAHVLRGLHFTGMTLKQAVSQLPDLCTVQHELVTSLTRQNIEHLRRENTDTRVSILMPPHSKLVKLRVHADSVEAAAEMCTFWEKKLHLAESEQS